MKLLIVAGTRPNFIKIAGLLYEISKFPTIRYIIVHTGQHYDINLSDIFFRQLKIPAPNVNLGVGSANRVTQIKEIKRRFKPVLKKHKPDVVAVVGDVNSTVACAELSHRLGVKVAHIEAGLRSFDRSMPEELNRIRTDKVSDFLFTTERTAYTNLCNEGIESTKIYFVGNIMIDTLLKNLKHIRNLGAYKKFNLIKEKYGVVTFHRPSNVDSRKNLTKLLNMINIAQRELKLIIPLHPRTKASIKNFALERLLNNKNISVVNPLGYFEFLNLVINSKLVLTDSGGIQEETTFLKIPCITMRSNTERPVTINQGTNVLVANDTRKTLKEIKRIIDGKSKISQKSPELWDGKTAGRILQVLSRVL
ncbi:MAG: UDP-N-acetylglucosamine 2-epimerase (non-hydrolyzing) [Candidatus Dojkabacteria bacterium]|nr:UDP-N-acetylglucosamine 2-epimerase (non-hydrolyzing) [Candidatus Dojkabacteria bacterium]